MKKYFCVVRMASNGYLLTFEYIYIEPELLMFHLGPKDHYFEVCQETFKHHYKGPNLGLKAFQDLLDDQD